MGTRTEANTVEPASAALIAEAACWLAGHDDRTLPGPTTRVLREAFGLGFNDACKAIAEARRIAARG